LDSKFKISLNSLQPFF